MKSATTRPKVFPNKLDFADIQVGDTHGFNRILGRKDGLAFAKLSGDFNPLHVDKSFGKKSAFKDNVAHGILVAGFFSALVGMYCPGEKSLYLSQTVRFLKPVFYGDILRVKGLVAAKSDGARTIRLKTEAWRGKTKVVDGEALVKVLP